MSPVHDFYLRCSLLCARHYCLKSFPKNQSHKVLTYQRIYDCGKLTENALENFFITFLGSRSGGRKIHLLSKFLLKEQILVKKKELEQSIRLKKYFCLLSTFRWRCQIKTICGWGTAKHRGRIRASHPAVLGLIPGIPKVFSILLRFIDSTAA